MAYVNFHVTAVPVAQPRVKARAFGGRAQVYNPTTITNKTTGETKTHPIVLFKASVAHAAGQVYQGEPLTGPISLSWVCLFPRPANKIWKTKPMPREFHTGKPDRDNIDKAILDALKNVIIADDRSVCAGSLEKYIASGAEQPGVFIRIQTLDF